MKQLIFCAPIVILIGLSGCGEANVPSGQLQSASPELPSEAPKTGELRAESPGKPTAPIGVRYEILGRPAIGQPLEIRITTHSNAVVNALTTQVRGDEGLFVSPTNANFAVAQMRFEEPVARTLTVTPLREGAHQLTVLVQGEIGGVVQSAQISIPVRVGDVQPAPKPTGTLSTDESGEAIISLPAQQN